MSRSNGGVRGFLKRKEQVFTVPEAKPAVESTAMRPLEMKWMTQQLVRFRMECGSFTESPIEDLFLGAMLVSGYSRATFARYQISEARSLDSVDMGKFCGAFTSRSGVDVVTQLDVLTEDIAYMVDFAAFARGYRFAIDLDGHDFYERSKEQARSDKSRDRALIGQGWIVIRFTGSEVFADPIGCVRQFEAIVKSTLERAPAARDADTLASS